MKAIKAKKQAGELEEVPKLSSYFSAHDEGYHDTRQVEWVSGLSRTFVLEDQIYHSRVK